jgi:hypothetical protein
MLVLLPTYIYQNRSLHWAILIWQRRMKVCYIALLWDIILCRSFICEFWGLYRGDFNPCKSYTNMGISKCCYFICWDSQMLKNLCYPYHTFKHDISIFMDCLHAPINQSVSSRIVYTSQSTYQTFLIVISVQDVDGRIILRWIFTKLEGVAGTGWSWLRTGTGGGHLWVRWGTFGFHKCGEFLD